MPKRRLIIIAGPTSVGKTRVALDVAKMLDTEIVSADSMQVYKGMDIGTAKIKEEEMCGIPHHLIDVLDPTEEFNASRFRELALKAIDDIGSHGRIPVIAGGTGFYIKSLLYGESSDDPGKDIEYRDGLRLRADKGELPQMYEELMIADPVYAGRVHPNDRSRITRALEYCHSTGKRYSDYGSIDSGKEPEFEFLYFALSCDRERLYERIDGRVDSMIENGLVDEVRSLVEKGVDRTYTSMNGIGYKEIYGYLMGETDLDTAVAKIKLNTRHYVVRQLTWFRNLPGINWIDSESESAADEIVRKVKEIFPDA